MTAKELTKKEEQGRRQRLRWDFAEPSSGEDRHHVLILNRVDDDDWDVEILHPESCSMAFYDPPDHWGQVRSYRCPMAEEISNVGYDTIFPDGKEEGVFLVRVWWQWHASSVAGPGEMDGGVEVVQLQEVKP